MSAEMQIDGQPACAVASIDGHPFGPAEPLISRLIDAWRSNPCQTI